MPLGIYAIHPLDGRKIPIWVGNYVLAEYGEGAVMGVPAHDERDFEFANRYHIPIIRVIESENAPTDGAIIEEGTLIHSGPFDGLSSREAKEKITEALAEKGLGQRQMHYRLHDWGISRQRYWGCPIPWYIVSIAVRYPFASKICRLFCQKTWLFMARNHL